MKVQSIIKAECLLTRACNLNCPYCEIIKKRKKELSVEVWWKIIDILYGKLGADFLCFYGGEPLTRGDEFLCSMFEHLNFWQKKGKNYSVISNSIGLTKNRMKKFIEKGLDSWTTSIDFPPTRFDQDVKSEIGYKALNLFKALGLRDCTAIITITRQNLPYVRELIEHLSERGFHIGIDFYHYKRCEWNEFSPGDLRSDAKFMLTEREMPEIQSLAEWCLKHYDLLKIFPSKEVIEMWKNPKYPLCLEWKCSTTASITVDCDGSMGGCDDFWHPTINKWNILDLDKERNWELFSKDMLYTVKHQCSGCFWSTHVGCENILLEKDAKVKYEKTKKFTHGALNF